MENFVGEVGGQSGNLRNCTQRNLSIGNFHFSPRTAQWLSRKWNNCASHRSHDLQPDSALDDSQLHRAIRFMHF